MKGYIYQILNKKDNKSYIGSTNNILTRKRKHFKALKDGIHHNEILQRAYNKYGIENFEFVILKEFENISRDELYLIENEYVQNYESSKLKNGYNINDPANKPPNNTGRKHTEETKKKMSEWQIGRQFTEEHKRNISLSLKGKCFFSDEAKKKMSERMKGNSYAKGNKIIVSEETREKLRIASTGRKHTEETKLKIKIAKQNISDETRQKMSKAQKGKIPWNKGLKKV